MIKGCFPIFYTVAWALLSCPPTLSGPEPKGRPTSSSSALPYRPSFGFHGPGEYIPWYAESWRRTNEIVSPFLMMLVAAELRRRQRRRRRPGRRRRRPGPGSDNEDRDPSFLVPLCSCLQSCFVHEDLLLLLPPFLCTHSPSRTRSAPPRPVPGLAGTSTKPKPPPPPLPSGGTNVGLLRPSSIDPLLSMCCDVPTTFSFESSVLTQS